ncbi:hypothetical protein [Arthrobacter sp. NPDC057013]
MRSTDQPMDMFYSCACNAAFHGHLSRPSTG